MLVLTRKTGETVEIEDDDARIVITVLKVQGKSVSLGINAPKSMRIFRGELLDDDDEELILEHELETTAVH